MNSDALDILGHNKSDSAQKKQGSLFNKAESDRKVRYLLIDFYCLSLHLLEIEKAWRQCKTSEWNAQRALQLAGSSGQG